MTPMNDVPGSRTDAHLLRRLHELKAEYDSGQKQLAMLEARTLELRNTLLRISGAIQVLEELAAPPPPADQNGREP
jgi:hypothetical protein